MCVAGVNSGKNW